MWLIVPIYGAWRERSVWPSGLPVHEILWTNAEFGYVEPAVSIEGYLLITRSR
jgi:hypothetical protein